MFINFERTNVGELHVQSDSASFVEKWAQGHNVPVNKDFVVSAKSGNVTMWAWNNWEKDWPFFIQSEAIKHFAKAMRIWDWMRHECKCVASSSVNGMVQVLGNDVGVLQDIASECYVSDFERCVDEYGYVHFYYTVAGITLAWCGKKEG